MNGLTLWSRLRNHVDWALLSVVMAIAAIGLVNLYSATRAAPKQGMFEQQIWWMVIGFGTMVVFTVLDYRVWLRFAWMGLVVIGVAVAAVKFGGHVAHGSRRWFQLGPARIQPSEFAKLAVILALARFVHDRGAEDIDFFDLGARFAALVGIIMMIAWQPDLGTAILVTLICLSVLLLAVKQIWTVIAGLCGFAAFVPIIWVYVLRPYQKKRVLTFMDLTADPTGAGWHARQSIFAIGSGRLAGKGYLHGTQNQFNFLPEHWTDFPFSVWAEEWGFAGSIVLLGLYLFLILWTINVASQARDRFGATLCVGVAAMFFWHVIVNIGMVTGLAPVVGVTLPLVSYGGSSVLTMFIGLGLVASVSIRRYAH